MILLSVCLLVAAALAEALAVTILLRRVRALEAAGRPSDSALSANDADQSARKVPAEAANASVSPPSCAILTNEQYIRALNQAPALSDKMGVFRYVFHSLPDDAMVYPTENYYYFQFPSWGGTVWGSLRLSPLSRDNGVIRFSYCEKQDRPVPRMLSYEGDGGELSAKHGVVVEKIHDFQYSVGFEGKTVRFHLNDMGAGRPRRGRLTADEIFVGPNFDESGLRFSLVFNDTHSRLYWILNEDELVPERFQSYSADVAIGKRTGYAFFVDAENERKILIAAEGSNVLTNNWYDGPFDQTPENYVYTGRIELQKYIEASYPDARGRIDKYGNYLDLADSRVAVANCFVYYDPKELDFVEQCKATAKTRSELYCLLTRQIFRAPVFSQ